MFFYSRSFGFLNTDKFKKECSISCILAQRVHPRGKERDGEVVKDEISICPVSLNRCPRNNGHRNEYEAGVA